MIKLKVGITGSIGAGKSTVAKYFYDSGYAVLYADIVAKELYGLPAIKKNVINEFGADTYSGDLPDYKKIAEKAFKNSETVFRLNSIIFPFLKEKVFSLMNDLSENEDIIFCEAALLYEAEMEDLFDYVILITAEKELRIARAARRLNLSVEEVEKRLSFQLSDDVKKSRADFTIENNSDFDTLFSNSDFILGLIKSIARV